MNSFFFSKEEELTERFLHDGYIIFRNESQNDLDWIRREVCLANGRDDLDHAEPSNLNAVKLKVMKHLNEWQSARRAYFNLAAEHLYAIVGNELAMQKKFNLNVQVPNDERNLLPIHADTWTGDSPFQVVLWVPLVDCYKTKAMWLLPPEHLGSFRLEGSSEDMFAKIEPHIKYLEVKYGEVLLFNSTLPHGNRVNREDSTRWSLNCRFKSVFSPYGRKELGEHFEPITLRAASRIGMAYRHPA